ncbi:hypothetical protein EON81_29295 [bacterium]|nr:MAG: hypothetical protein EON81_29295 [bacterium]
MLLPALLLIAGPKPSAPKIYQPKAGSPERKALMEALRRAVTPSLRQAVVFRVDWIRSNGSAAFFEGYPSGRTG